MDKVRKNGYVGIQHTNGYTIDPDSARKPANMIESIAKFYKNGRFSQQWQ